MRSLSTQTRGVPRFRLRTCGAEVSARSATSPGSREGRTPCDRVGDVELGSNDGEGGRDCTDECEPKAHVRSLSRKTPCTDRWYHWRTSLRLVGARAHPPGGTNVLESREERANPHACQQNQMSARRQLALGPRASRRPQTESPVPPRTKYKSARMGASVTRTPSGMASSSVAGADAAGIPNADACHAQGSVSA